MARNFGRGGSGLSFFIRRDAWQKILCPGCGFGV